MNARQMMYKLQAALCRNDRAIRINQRQFYSEDMGKMISQYILIEGNDTLLESYSPIEVVRFLAKELGDG